MLHIQPVAYLLWHSRCAISRLVEGHQLAWRRRVLPVNRLSFGRNMVVATATPICAMAFQVVSADLAEYICGGSMHKSRQPSKIRILPADKLTHLLRWPREVMRIVAIFATEACPTCEVATKGLLGILGRHLSQISELPVCQVQSYIFLVPQIPGVYFTDDKISSSPLRRKVYTYVSEYS